MPIFQELSLKKGRGSCFLYSERSDILST